MAKPTFSLHAQISVEARRQLEAKKAVEGCTFTDIIERAIMAYVPKPWAASECESQPAE